MMPQPLPVPVAAKRLRAKSFSLGTSTKLHTPSCVSRAQSCDCTAHPQQRVSIAYTDEALCANSRTNMYGLLHAAQQPDGSQGNNAFMAKKALQYRNMLVGALAANMDDPAFQLTDFLRVKWCKTERPRKSSPTYLSVNAVIGVEL